MSKINLRVSLTCNENIIYNEQEFVGIYNSDTISYKENDILVTLKLKPNKEIKMKRKNNNYNIELIFIENKETNGLYELKKYGNIPLTVFTKKLICDNHIYIEYYLNKQDELYKLNLFYEVK